MASIGMGTQAAQNKAHREDMEWFKSGKSEYMHCSGEIVIRKVHPQHWKAFKADGTELLCDKGFPIYGPSLTWAKASVNVSHFKIVY